MSGDQHLDHGGARFRAVDGCFQCIQSPCQCPFLGCRVRARRGALPRRRAREARGRASGGLAVSARRRSSVRSGVGTPLSGAGAAAPRGPVGQPPIVPRGATRRPSAAAAVAPSSDEGYLARWSASPTSNVRRRLSGTGESTLIDVAPGKHTDVDSLATNVNTCSTDKILYSQTLPDVDASSY